LVVAIDFVGFTIPPTQQPLCFFFGVDQVTSAEEARRADTDRYATFFQGMMDRGVFLPPSAFESAFLSDAHGEAEIDRTLEAADEALEGAS